MTPTATILIITSAFLHALWNFVSKRTNPSLAFFFVTALSASLIISPLLFWQRHLLTLIPLALWVIILTTGIAQAVYFFGLAGSYRLGDISVAYPLARALPVLFVALVSILLGKRAEIGNLGLFGMVLVTLGCIILPLQQFHNFRLQNYLNPICLLALIAAIGTTGYTLIDDHILRTLRTLLATRLSIDEVSLLFVGLQASSTALMLGLSTLIFRAEREQFVAIVTNRSMLLLGAVTGLVIMSGYGLVLASMAYVTNVSYVAAFRQLSIPLGAILGLTINKEPRYLPKLVGITIVTIGLVLVGIG